MAAAAGALTVVLCLLAGCGSTADGVRVEGSPASTPESRTDAAGPAHPDWSESAEGADPSAGPVAPRDTRDDAGDPPDATRGDERPRPRTDTATDAVGEPLGHRAVIALLKRDPKVSSEVKRGLKPCVGDRYPISVAHGQATGQHPTDLVVNVSSCADGIGVGAYVYRRSSSGALVNVFTAERPPVSAVIRGGLLKVTRAVYIGNEPMCCPSGQDIVTYAWRDGLFREVDRERGDLGDGPPPAP
ncbi:hypothetical protein AN216_24360 [Streptomyces oceani]|uniref:Lipoprotein CseA n=2 Tax=Streptomyces oceani TaxID=1075402 RepID=A0A1E7JV81_9ACTN|nr:hypothetical protein AN216_24360 [Streptomyces oceani]